jgi:hypothetical protein
MKKPYLPLMGSLHLLHGCAPLIGSLVGRIGCKSRRGLQAFEPGFRAAHARLRVGHFNLFAGSAEPCIDRSSQRESNKFSRNRCNKTVHGIHKAFA